MLPCLHTYKRLLQLVFHFVFLLLSLRQTPVSMLKRKWAELKSSHAYGHETSNSTVQFLIETTPNCFEKHFCNYGSM